MKLIQNGIKGEIHIRSKNCIVESLCCVVVPNRNPAEGDISQVTCKRCIKAYKESEKE